MRKRTTKQTVKDIEAAAEVEPAKATKKISRRDLLSTGSTLLNLALSDNPFGGFVKGKYYWIFGKSTSGKTFLAVSCFAEAVVSNSFKNHRLIQDNGEDGCLMEMERLFGKETAARIESPGVDKDGLPEHSRTIEDFYDFVDDALKDGRPFIYVLDSMDSVSSEYEGDKYEAHKRVRRGVGSASDKKGSYGDGKAKKNSEGLRQVVGRIKNTESILIILSQTRCDLNAMNPGAEIASGGKALKFYATVGMATSILGQIKKTVKGRMRTIGTKALVKTIKNRITGKLREATVDIYPSYGIDDIGSCVDYLVDEDWWKLEKKSIVAAEFDIKATREKLIHQIEEEGLEKELRVIVGKCWKEIEVASVPIRKAKY